MPTRSNGDTLLSLPGPVVHVATNDIVMTQHTEDVNCHLVVCELVCCIWLVLPTR